MSTVGHQRMFKLTPDHPVDPRITERQNAVIQIEDIAN
jgi:hypothetical protein